jgi:hypothetical protein
MEIHVAVAREKVRGWRPEGTGLIDRVEHGDIEARDVALTNDADVLSCPTCQGRMRLLAMVTDPKSIRRYLAKVGEPTEPPARSPSRGPPFWKSVVLRQKMLGGADLGA